MNGDSSIRESSRDECNCRVFEGIQGLTPEVIMEDGSSGVSV